MVSNKYSKQDCINSLIKAKKILGHAPSQHEYRQLDISPSYQTISNKFDRWNKAKEKVGMDTNRPSHLKYQDGCPEILSYTDDEWQQIDKKLRFRRRNQAYVARKKMENGCEKCGYDENPVALDFHHTDPKDKVSDISQMITQGYGSDKIKEEIEKCIVLCSNCHSIQESGDIYNV